MKKSLLLSILVCFMLSGCGHTITLDPHIKEQSIEMAKLIDNKNKNKEGLTSLQIDQITRFTDTSRFKDLSTTERDIMLNILDLANASGDSLQGKSDAPKKYEETRNKLKSILGDF